MTSAIQTDTRAGGRARGVGFGILLFIVTFGFYSWYWAFKTHEEMKQRTGDGVGGVIGLVIWILITAVSAFVIPSEIGSMYRKDGRESPVSGWTGLWFFPGAILIIPAIVWFVKTSSLLEESPHAASRGASDAWPEARGYPARSRRREWLRACRRITLVANVASSAPFSRAGTARAGGRKRSTPGDQPITSARPDRLRA